MILLCIEIRLAICYIKHSRAFIEAARGQDAETRVIQTYHHIRYEYHTHKERIHGSAVQPQLIRSHLSAVAICPSTSFEGLFAPITFTLPRLL